MAVTLGSKVELVEGSQFIHISKLTDSGLLCALALWRRSGSARSETGTDSVLRQVACEAVNLNDITPGSTTSFGSVDDPRDKHAGGTLAGDIIALSKGNDRPCLFQQDA